MAEPKRRRRARGEVVAVANQKGGTGKTTTVVNLGRALAERGRRVLLVDLDPQANLTYSLGIEPERGTMADVLAGAQGFGDVLVEREGMSIAPGSLSLADVEVSLAGESGREAFLADRLDRNGFDVVLVDTPPSLSVLTLNALNAADTVLIPLQMEVLGLQGLEQLLATIAEANRVFNRRLRVRGIVPVMVDSRRNLSREILAHIKHNVDEKVFQTVIRSSVRVAEAPSFAHSVVSYAPSSNGARDYRALAEEFINAP